uniref:F-box domain-containing protein n=1 Tax=Setaria italica TaxID=4555 RepID=K3ZC48_SETIT
MRLLPDDVLADVLRRGAPRVVATSRRVCTALRALIDSRSLLREDLVPRSLAGLFVNYNEMALAELFRPPSSMQDPADHYMPNACVRGHCNGVLLLFHGLLNPVAWWWAPLPELPAQHSTNNMWSCRRTTSNHPWARRDQVVQHVEISAALLELEWPPSPCVMNVFSTVTGRWTERSFRREGEAAGTVAGMRKGGPWLDGRQAVYWRGVLYAHCEMDFVMRISLSDNTYRMIRPPCGIEMCECPELHLGRSEKGVYCAYFDDERQLRVWILDESCGRMAWVLRHES